MDTTNFDAIRQAMEEAESAAWKALAGKISDLAIEAHEKVYSALMLIQAAADAPRCARPECSNHVPQKPLGRPALFCSRKCRDRTRYREARQAKAQQ